MNGNPHSKIRIDSQQKIRIDAKELISLRDDCFPELEGTEKHALVFWRWKHDTNQAGVHSDYLVASDEEELVLTGFYAARRLKYITPLGLVQVGLVCDVMTSPAYQGRGIFVQLGNEAVKNFLTANYDTLTGYPIRKNVLPGHRKVGWRFTDRLPVFVAPGLRIYWRALSRMPELQKFKIGTCEPVSFNKEIGFENFYEKWQQKAKVEKWSYLDLSDEFINWRYSAPGVNYVASIARDAKGEIVGCAIGRRLKIGRFHYLVVGDIRVLDKSVVPMLVNSLKLQIEKVIGVAGMFSDAVSNDLHLKRYGFIATFKKFWLIQFTRKMLALTEEFDTTLINPYLTWSDTDDI